MSRICSKLVSGLGLNLHQLAYLCYFTTLPVSFPLLNLPTAYLASCLLISSLFRLSIVSVISSFSVHRVPSRRSSNASTITDSSVVVSSPLLFTCLVFPGCFRHSPPPEVPLVCLRAFFIISHTVHVTSYFRPTAELPRIFSAKLRKADCRRR